MNDVETPHAALAVAYPRWSAYRDCVQDPAPPLCIHDAALPLVTVVMPALNAGPYIAAALSSILTQDYPNLEVWVLDAGSTDETTAVLSAYRTDPRLQVVVGRDAGQADAINRGWARARGDILAWLNADDTYTPGAIARQVAALCADPALGAVYADAQYTDQAGRPLRHITARAYDPLELVRLTIPAQPTVFLRREVIGVLGPLNVSLHYSMDSEYWTRLALISRMQRVDGVAATYRLHAQSKTVSRPAAFYAEWLTVAERYCAAAPVAPARRRAVLADIYAAMANREAQSGRARPALRYAAYAVTLAGLRPRLAKLLPALLDGWLGTTLSDTLAAAFVARLQTLRRR